MHLVYQRAARSLFKKDHLAFALHLIRGLYPDLIKENEWEVLTGTAGGGHKAAEEEPRPSWLLEERPLAPLREVLGPERWASLRLHEAGLWQRFGQSSEAELPEHAARSLSPFQQALLVQCLRPDRALTALGRFACRALGLRELCPEVVPLRQLLSGERQPLLLVTAPGADPGQELRDAAPNHYLQQVFLGTKQQTAASEALRQCAEQGSWLWLANLHLATQWLPTLAQELSRLDKSHPDFRLCLSTEPHPAIPSGLLKACQTVAYEPPSGVRRSMRRTYDAWGPSSLGGSLLSAQAHFALAWLHALLLERLAYVPQGWSKRYEFNEVDLRAAEDAVRRLCGGGGPEPWQALRGLLELSVYGAHLDNPLDRRVLATYLGRIFDRSTLPGTTEQQPACLAPAVRAPTTVSFQAHVQLIEQLADEEPVRYLGLAANVDGSVQRLGTTNLVGNLRRLQATPSTSTTAAADRLAPLLSLWKSLHQGSHPPQQTDQPEDESEDAVAGFLRQERAHAARLAQLVHSTLAAVSRALRRGGAGLPEEAWALANHRVPDRWLALWSGGGRQWSPEAYLRAVARRAQALQRWAFGTTDPLRLGQLLRPGAFLSAWRLQTARQTSTAVDELNLELWWGEDGGPPLRAILGGLHCEGGLVEDARLRHCRPGAPSLLAVPPCFAAWLPPGRREKHKMSAVTMAMYTSLERQELAASVVVPCDGHTDQWLLSGAALFLSTMEDD